MAISSRHADDDETIVVAPQERSPQVKKYLVMATSLDTVIGTRRELDVDQLLDLVQERTGAVSLSADSGLHLQGFRSLAESIQRDSYYDEIGRRVSNHYLYNWIRKYVQF